LHEFAFTAASVGRLVLSLHQAIRGHRIALPDDELVSVRLRKNTLGVYRLDHDSGQHDDQAVALALGTHYLIGSDTGAESWGRGKRGQPPRRRMEEGRQAQGPPRLERPEPPPAGPRNRWHRPRPLAQRGPRRSVAARTALRNP
jgi:hypothetical protein